MVGRAAALAAPPALAILLYTNTLHHAFVYDDRFDQSTQSLFDKFKSFYVERDLKVWYPPLTMCEFDRGHALDRISAPISQKPRL